MKWRVHAVVDVGFGLGEFLRQAFDYAVILGEVGLPFVKVWA